ncbi:ABC transporter ATP-binding protein/permease [Paenibacillus polysaccharolyticus]|uniref:ABC transporter ATP-binding protein n=1 Tax=Paenibacillus polysaccharolyticus TaxID=582692 RepID=UPI0020A16ACA|nr:ABC transporter ATP-binding protein [Paenibacillus polysaccharolyticus]MCP1132765.1 ABC transporter ATP-binding protein/permease [Paenibacillus polysaccharolyticus]
MDEIISTKKTLSLLWGYLKKYWMILAFLPFLMLVDVSFEIGVAKIQGLFIDTATTGTKEELFSLIKLVISLLLAGILFLSIHRHIIVKLLGYVHRDLTLRLFDVLNNMPYQKIKMFHSGELVSRVKEDVEHSSKIIESLIEFATVLLLIIFSFIYLIRIDVVLALLGAFGSPVLFMIGRIFDRKIRNQSSLVQEKELKLRETSQEFIQGLAVVKIYGAKNLYVDQFERQRGELNQSQTKLAMVNSMSRTFTEGSFQLIYIVALIFIAIAASRDSLTPGTIVTFSVLFELVVWPVLGMSNQYSQVQEGVGAFRRINEFLKTNRNADSETIISKEQGLLDKDTVLSLENVSFQPESSHEAILKNVNFKLKKDETVIVIGASGSGKSSLAKVCSGLYVPTSGRVVIREETDSTQNAVYVSQSAYLFSGSIRENMELNLQGITDHDISKASTLAGLETYIEQLPESYNTLISEQGSNFSGGQKQRLALSRAFIRTESDFIIMDEPTSALDKGNEQKIVESMKNFLKNKAAILITHRLSLLPLADRIIVMNEGGIAEVGTQSELMNKKGFYWKIKNAGIEEI